MNSGIKGHFSKKKTFQFSLVILQMQQILLVLVVVLVYYGEKTTLVGNEDFQWSQQTINDFLSISGNWKLAKK